MRPASSGHSKSLLSLNPFPTRFNKISHFLVSRNIRSAALHRPAELPVCPSDCLSVCPPASTAASLLHPDCLISSSSTSSAYNKKPHKQFPHICMCFASLSLLVQITTAISLITPLTAGELAQRQIKSAGDMRSDAATLINLADGNSCAHISQG